MAEVDWVGAGADASKSKQVSVMLQAAKDGDLVSVQHHIGELGADACHQAYRRTALHWAAENGDVSPCSSSGINLVLTPTPMLSDPTV